MKSRVKMCILLFTMVILILIGSLGYKKECNAIVVNIKEEHESLFANIIRVLPEKEEESDLIYLGEFLLTGYCDCPICQEEWVGTTALGVAPTPEWTIAVDPDVIPLGSYVVINGHTYRAEDVGGMINYNHIDIFCSSHEECYSDFCNGYTEVYLVR